MTCRDQKSNCSFVQYGIGSPRQNNQTGKINKRNPSWTNNSVWTKKPVWKHKRS